ncbi:TIGR03086 family metal-binding protein [Nocardia sp. BMG111209]|uniref:TIGR03086 family metal-binding protein n=1 Tax=Nocardia sp. BMG111209 TaxID=1160137 RepID=UPI0003673A70|nr:TIGR03086 family metal-binding protein [Nocardia sp. BMG111209]
MSTPIDRIDAALEMAAGIVIDISADRLAGPSLCPGWSLGFELNHLVGGMRIFAAELSGAVVDRDHHDDWLGNDHRAAFAIAADLDGTAWHRPDALESTVRLGFGPVPGAMAAVVHLTELVVHSADLAVAVGNTDRIDDTLCGQLLETMRSTGFDSFRQPGMFGAEIAESPQAAGHRRLLAFTGRNPAGR